MKFKKGVEREMCRECKSECIGDIPCISGKVCSKVKNSAEISVPNCIVVGLITLIFYFMWR